MPINLATFANIAQEVKKKSLVQKVTNESLFMRILDFIPVDALAYKYSEQTTTGGIAFRALNDNYAEDIGVVNPKSENLAILGGMVKTDHQLVNKQGGTARASQILAKTKRAGLTFDKNVIRGDTAADANSFDGLRKRLTGGQVIEAAANGADLTLEMIDDLIDRVLGPNDRKHLVMNKRMRRKMKQLILAEAGGAGVADFGGSLPTYDGVKVEVLDEDGDDDPILKFDETQGTTVETDPGVSDDATTSIYCVVPGRDSDGELLQGLIGSPLIETYPSGMDGVLHVDVIELNAGIALFHPRCAARLKGLLKPAA